MNKTLDGSNVKEQVRDKFPEIWEKVYAALKEGEANKESAEVIYGRVKQVITDEKSAKTVDLDTIKIWISM
jgi:hypothetical protein